jgi:hemerythrin-like metal-binding protein
MSALSPEQTTGFAPMDDTHAAFLALLATAQAADDTALLPAFSELVEHTRRHFEDEAKLMRACRFSAAGEHENEHRRVLGEMSFFLLKLKQGRRAAARAWLAEGAADWFRSHLATMDSALAAQCKQAGLAETA